MAKALVPPDFSSQVQFPWRPGPRAICLALLRQLTPTFGSSLLALMGNEIQNNLVDWTIKLPRGVDQFIAVSRLLKAGTCLNDDQRNKLVEIREKYKASHLILDIKDRATFESINTPHIYEACLGQEIYGLAAATLNQPIDRQLLQLLSHTALKIDDSHVKWWVYSRVCDAMPRLSKGEQEHLFNSTIAIGTEELQGGPVMSDSTISLFKSMVQKSEGLATDKLEILVAFILDYKKLGYTDLLYSLAKAARQNAPLRCVVINAMEERKKNDAIIGLVLDVIRIDQLDEKERLQLVKNIFGIENDSEKCFMLFLLAGRIDVLPLDIHDAFLDAIFSIDDTSKYVNKFQVLYEVASGIVHLSTKNRNRLLSAIKTLRFGHAETIAAAAYSLGLLQPQAASSSNP